MEVHISDLNKNQINDVISKIFGHSKSYKNYLIDHTFLMKIQSLEQIDITHWPQLRGDVENWIMASITSGDVSFVQYGRTIEEALLKVYIEKTLGQVVLVDK